MPRPPEPTHPDDRDPVDVPQPKVEAPRTADPAANAATGEPEAIAPAERTVDVDAGRMTEEGAPTPAVLEARESADRAADGAASTAVRGDRQASPNPNYDLLWRTGLLNVLAIAGRELRGYFISPVGWVVTPILVIVVSAFGYLLPVLGQQQASMDGVFGVLAFFLVLPIMPLYTMRLISEERRQGTLETMLTSPVRDWELVLGKWLGAYGFFIFSILFTLAYVALFAIFLPDRAPLHVLGLGLSIGNLDWGLILGGYLGILLVGATFTAVGLLCSSLTQNQIIAAFITFGVLVVIWFAGLLTSFVAPPYDRFLDYLSAQNHYSPFGRGQMAVKDVVYFVTVVAGALFLSTRVLDSRRWR